MPARSPQRPMPACIQLWKLVNDRDDRWIVPFIDGGWHVTLEPMARAKRILNELPDLLAEMEKRGFREYRRRLTRSRIVEPVEALAIDLGITSARRLTPARGTLNASGHDLITFVLQGNYYVQNPVADDVAVIGTPQAL
jgi:hypothetical protein